MDNPGVFLHVLAHVTQVPRHNINQTTMSGEGKLPFFYFCLYNMKRWALLKGGKKHFIVMQTNKGAAQSFL